MCYHYLSKIFRENLSILKNQWNLKLILSFLFSLRTNMEDLRYESASQYFALMNQNDINDFINGTVSPMNSSLTNTTKSQFFNNTLSNNEPVSQIPPKEWYIIIYSIFIAAAIILTPLSRNVLYIIYMRSSKNLHNKMFGNILQAPMRFFDTNPSGK